MMTKLTLYHGSNKIIKKPIYNYGNTNNDFGEGFYCTDDKELAHEWACQNNENGYCNKYKIDISNTHILDLRMVEHPILSWLAILIKNRTFDISNNMKPVFDFIINNFYIDVDKYDIVIGYRADDSYYQFAESFLNNSLSLSQLKKALSLGELGIQYVIKSESAFKKIHFIKAEQSDKDKYFVKYILKEESANKEFNTIIYINNNTDDIYAIDLIRGVININDPRL